MFYRVYRVPILIAARKERVMDLQPIVDLISYPLADDAFRAACRARLAEDGVLVMQRFLRPVAIRAVREDGIANQHRAYFCRQLHNVYLRPSDPLFPADHPRNRQIVSSKGCITDDVVPQDSMLRTLYDSPLFKDYLCCVLGEKALHPYADPLSSINIHYAKTGQELGWHFDNSSFAITLMIEPAVAGGTFEYVTGVRNADAGEMSYDAVADVLDKKVVPKVLAMDSGALVLFRGRNAMHRVTPVERERTRMLAVLAYNSAPGVSLSESARMTFYGRLR
jgi:hypothetical protein